MHVQVKTRLPSGQALLDGRIPELDARLSALEALWHSEDPQAVEVLLEYHFDDWADTPAARDSFLVRVGQTWLAEPLPSAWLTDPEQDSRLREYIRRSSRDRAMRVAHPVAERVRRWLRGFVPDARAQARTALEGRFLEEARQEALISHLASQLKYPQDRAHLSVIAGRKREHLEKLKNLIQHFGGTTPAFEPPDLQSRTWQGLCAALEDEMQDVEGYHELRPLLQDDPAITEQLEVMIDDERANASDLRGVLSELDPYAYREGG